MNIFDEPKRLEDWLSRVRSERTNHENTWQEIADHMLGMRQFTSRRDPGRPRTELIYDTTAKHSHRMLAGAVQALSINPVSDWLDTVPENPELLEDLENALWFEDTTRRMMFQLRSASSGFVQNSAQVLLDLTGFHTAGMSVLEPPVGRGIKCVAHPLAELYLELDADGAVATRFRVFELTARQIQSAYPHHGVEEVERALKSNAETKFEVRQVVARSDDPYAGQTPFRKAWITVVWMNVKTPKIISKGGFDQNPLVTPRWDVDSGETYGTGPGRDFLPNAKMLNEMMKTILKAGQKVVDPPLLVTHEAVLSKIRTYPGGINIINQLYGSTNTPDAIRPLVNQARLDLGVDLLELVQNQVKRGFHAELLQLFEDPRMNATQVIELANQVTRLLAPILGRFQAEFQEPLAERVFRLMWKQGMFLPLPQGLRGRSYKILFQSPVSRAQRSGEARAAIEVWQAAAMIAQASGSMEALELLDAEQTIRLLVEAQGAPRRILRDAAAVIARRRAAEEERQEERGVMMAGELSKASEQVASAVKQLSEAGSQRLQLAA